MPVPAHYDLRPERAALCDLYDAVETHFGRPAAVLMTPQPTVSAWSVGHHLDHVARVNGDIFEWLRQVALGDAEGDEAKAEQHPLALRLLASGNFGRGRAQAPERYHPSEDLSVPVLRASWLATREQLDALASHLDVLEDSRAHRKHFILGSLTVDLWLRLAHVHTAHHLGIIREIEEVQEAA